MSETTKRLKPVIRRKLINYVGKELSHCGHEPAATLATQEREKLLDWLISEIEKCENEAVTQHIKLGGPG